MPKAIDPARNTTYRDTYHFANKGYIQSHELPSVHSDATINTSIKENPYKSNVEIEKDEIVLKPDLTALFKAHGKKHSQGGIDVELEPNSFIFSDDKSLAFDDTDYELFEFKKGGSLNPYNHTPASVLKRNVPLKHYNTLVNNLTDKYKDPLSKKSSAMMLQKYTQSLGNIAYVQEEKKDFPDGLPAFSQGTAPVYDTYTKDKVMQEKQFSKYGGSVHNPYYAGGGPFDNYHDCPCGRDKTGKCLPCSDEVYDDIIGQPSTQVLKNQQDVGAGYNNIYNKPKGSLYGKFNTTTTGGPKMSNEDWINFLKNESAAHKATRLAKQQDNDKYQYVPNDFKIPLPKNVPDIYPDETTNIEDNWQTPEDHIDPNEVTGQQEGAKEANWGLTPWQKLSLATSFGQYAGAKRYMPFRSRFNASYAEPSLVNPEQAINDVKGAYNQQVSSLNTLNPILRNAQAASAYGQVLNTTPGIRSQYDNANAGITNQFRMYNNQVKNNETLNNNKNDQDYYRESVIGQQNFDNMRNFLGNQAKNELFGDVSQNQALAYSELTQRPLTNGKMPYEYDFRTGKFIRNPMNIKDVYSLSSGDTFQAMMAQAKAMKDAGFTPQEVSAMLRSNAFGKVAPFLSNNLQLSQMMAGVKTRKKGGTHNPYRY